MGDKQDLRRKLERRIKGSNDRKAKERRSGLEFRCPHPGHEDSDPSAWMGDYGWDCKGCGRNGSLYDLAGLVGVSYESGYTLKRYAMEKRLHAPTLRRWGLETVEYKGNQVLAIPYNDPSGDLLRIRYRGMEGARWWEGRDRDIHLYGLDHLPDPQGARVFVVEGESDCHAFWHEGMNAVGLPGANTWRSDWKRHLEGYEIIVWQEPDQGGVQMVESLQADLPDARVIDGSRADAGDPAELRRRHKDEFEERINRLAKTAYPIDVPEPSVAISEVSREDFRHLLERKQEGVEAVPTPFPTWNDASRARGGREGIGLGWHVIIGARSGTGKTLAACNLAASALRAGRSVTFFTLESSREEIVTRILAASTDTPSGKLEVGGLDQDMWQAAVEDFLGSVCNGARLYMNEDPGGTLDDIKRAFRYQYEVRGTELFIVDYLQLAWTGRADGIYERVTEVSHAIRELATELGVASVGLSQINRQASRDDSEPTKHSLLGGSSLENDADQVVLLDHTATEETPDGHIEGRMILDKNRHGPPVDDIPTLLNTETLKMSEQSRRDDFSYHYGG